MIKNALIAASVLLAGCAEAAAPAEGLQGVVELDERPLALELPGTLRAVPARRGQIVKQGEVLAALDEGLERPQREARAADLRSAQAQLDLLLSGTRPEDIAAAAAQVRAARALEAAAADAVERARTLVAGSSAPRSLLQDSESQHRRAVAERQAAEERHRGLRKGARREELAAARARVESAAAALALADARLGRMELRAPIAGAILEVHREPAEVVAAGQPIVTLGDMAHPYVDLLVPQGQLREVRVGLAAEVRVDAEQRPFAGRVEDVARRTEFTPRYLFSPKERAGLVVRVRVRIDDPEGRLHAGVPARARLDVPPFREGP